MTSDVGPVAIQGIKVEGPGPIPVRREIRELRTKYPDQWNLYLLGMERFQEVDEAHPLSYYKIAGIHGLPYETWPKENWNTKMPPAGGDKEIGFCTHSSVIFTTWHRPYLALFEAELYKHVNHIASLYTDPSDKERYTKAAKDFRMPYWDWALNNGGIIANEVLEKGFSVKRPDHDSQKNKPAEINPLYSYKFGKLGKEVPRLNKLGNGVTVRYPDEQKKSTDREVAERFRNLYNDKEEKVRWTKGKNLTERFLYVIQSYTDFNGASSNLFRMGNHFENWGSMEDIHNMVHNYVGGKGHMANTQTSAFDPIFWLHHTNIDRMLAIWQIFNEDPKVDEKWVMKANSQDKSWLTREGDPEDKHTPLWPFNKNAANDGAYWTSDEVRKTETFGYVYPEMRKSDFPTRKSIIDHLTAIYPQASLANTVMLSRKAPDTLAEATTELQDRAFSILAAEKVASLDASALLEKTLPPAVVADVQAANITVPKRAPTDLVKNNKYLEWLVDIKAEKHALGGDFIVHVFLGPPEDDRPDLYIANPTHVGSFSTLGQPLDTGCAKCQDDQASRLQVTGQIPLTVALVERYLAGQINGLAAQQDQVIGFLKRALHWRVTAKDGSPIDRRRLGEGDKLVVAVVSNEVTLPTMADALPIYAPSVVAYPEITSRDGNPRGDGTGFSGWV